MFLWIWLSKEKLWFVRVFYRTLTNAIFIISDNINISRFFICEKFFSFKRNRCLRGSKSPHKMSLKMYLMNRSTPFPVTFLVVISKETGGWLLSERAQIIFESVKMNLSPTPSETFCNGLDFGTFSFGLKERILKIRVFQALNNTHFIK